MAWQRQITILFGLLIAACLIFLAVLSGGPSRFDLSAPSHQRLDRKEAEARRLHDLAIRDLRETQDEIAKMKAHGIGMTPVSVSSDQAQ